MRILLAVGILIPAIARAHEGHAPLPSKGATVNGDRLMLSDSAAGAIGLQVAKVELTELRRVIRAVGSVDLPWSQQAFVTSLIPGKVTQVLVKPGETVAAGQELARVESVEIEDLQLALLQASAELSFVARLLDRQEGLAADMVIPHRTVLATRTEVQKDRARLNCAWQKLRAIGLSPGTLEQIRVRREKIRWISITSPIAGIISSADVSPGQMVDPSEHLFRIVDLSRIWIIGKVLETDVGQVRTGQPVRVTFPMLGNKVFSAEIDHMELRLNPDHTLSIKAYLDNPAGLLRPGMFCRLAIQSGAEKAVVAPQDALIHDGDATFALVRESKGNFVRKAIETGLLSGATVEITDGLFPGDTVVTTGSHELAALFASPAAETQSAVKASSADATTPDAVIAQGKIKIPTSQKLIASAPIDGRIRRILVEHGQSVRKGQVLADLESLEFQSLQLDLIEARAMLAQASVNLGRLRGLAESNSIAQKDLWEAESQQNVLEHSVDALRRKLSVVGLSTDQIMQVEATDIANPSSTAPVSAVLPIRAPGDGLIAEFQLVPGEVVKGRHALFEIHDPARMWVQAYLFEQDAVGVKTGRTVEVTLVCDPSFRSAGTIDRISPVLVSGNRALTIWIELDNPHQALREDMSAIVAIQTGKPSPRLAETAE
jgi:cobalt-zinc-cadmium efflux system membrane fusion protein